MSYPERIVPDETEPGVVAIHLKRYEFARPLCEGLRVLDAACGVGYGTAYLGERAARVIGVDVSEEALAYGRERYGGRNIEFIRADLQALPFGDASFDVVCAFEAIEHLDDPERFVAEAARVLHRDGVLIASTPNVRATTHSPDNPFHRVELAPRDFESLLAERFSSVELLGQRRVETMRHRWLRRADVLGVRRRLPFLRTASRLTGTSATADVDLEGLEIVPGKLETATELVAVCRR